MLKSSLTTRRSSIGKGPTAIPDGATYGLLISGVSVDPNSEVMKGLSECKASKSNIRRIRVKDVVKEVKDYLKTYSSAGMDIS
ncbi:hypothetical protein Tco_1442254, partial [Tanacetum coccineum]